MPFDIGEHLFHEGTALVLHGEKRVKDNDLAQIPKLSDRARAKIGVAVLSNTPLTDACLNHLLALPNLQKLYLQNTAITDQAPLDLFSHSLEVVNLDNTLVGDGAIHKLSLAPKLRVLSARNTRVSDRGAQLLAKSEALQEYYFEGTQVTEFGLRSLNNAMFRTTPALFARWAYYSTQIGTRGLSRCFARAWLGKSGDPQPLQRLGTGTIVRIGSRIPLVRKRKTVAPNNPAWFRLRNDGAKSPPTIPSDGSPFRIGHRSAPDRTTRRQPAGAWAAAAIALPFRRLRIRSRV